MTLEFRNIHHRYGGERVLADLSLTAEAGQITCLLGPSGCGKTTLLRIAAGLTPLQDGEIRLDGEVLATAGLNPPPDKRPVGLVFQEGALFPHLSVEGNVGFALAGDAAQRAARVAALLRHVGLSGFEHRYPHTLSGGQQQRVALARALAPEPRVMLLDEPFASIDITLRRRLREEMRLILKSSDVVTVLVTHDPEEALDMADRIAVMERGRIVQAGTPEALYDAPASASVATLIGGAQHVSAYATAEGLRTPFGLWPTSALAGPVPDGAVAAMVRPRALQLASGPACRVADVRTGGEAVRVIVAADSGETLIVEQPRGSTHAIGDPVAIAPHPSSVFAFALSG